MTMIFLSAKNGGISIASFATFIGAHVVIVSSSFSSTFSITIAILKNYQKQHKIKRKTIIRLLVRSKLNSVESTISKVLLNNEIRH